MRSKLSTFNMRVMQFIALTGYGLQVVDDEGRKNVVCALEEELLVDLHRRVARAGGYATVFVEKERGGVEVLKVYQESCSLESDPDPIEIQGSHETTVGQFLAYMSLRGEAVGLLLRNQNEKDRSTKAERLPEILMA